VPATSGSCAGRQGCNGPSPAQERFEPSGALLEVDVRSILSLIHAPTLLLHHTDFREVPIAHGRYLAEHIPGHGWSNCRAWRCGGSAGLGP
jgi:pimeloyl-ACP methyl ester carboxylesterase